MGKWRKLGLVWRPCGLHWWARSYAHMPTPELIDERTVRVYFATLDDHKFGRPGWVDVDARDPTRVLREARTPLLALGEPGTFADSGPVCIGHDCPDEFGISGPWVVRDADRYRMWYAIRSRSAPYRIGYAESLDGLTWARKDDQVGIHRSADGWDSEMVCFPGVIDVQG